MMPGRGQPDARVMIVGDFPSHDDVAAGHPFSGTPGYHLEKCLREAGIEPSQCFFTNVCREPIGDVEKVSFRGKTPPAGGRWVPVRSGWLTPEVHRGWELLQQELELVRPTVLVVVGNLALWLLVGEWSVASWRGSEMTQTDRTVIPTYHPSTMLRQWSIRPYVMADLVRARKVLERGTRLPEYRFRLDPTYAEALHTLGSLLAMCEEGPTHLSVDIETRSQHTICLGIAWSRTEAICIPFASLKSPSGCWTENEEWSILRVLRNLLEHPNARISGQNFSYDAQYLWRWWRIRPRLALDTMLTHHVCFPGTDKDLATLSSLYCEHHLYWKDDGKLWEGDADEYRYWRYNAMDCVRTWEIAEALQGVVGELGLEVPCTQQHEMWWLTFETMARGIRVDPDAKRALSATLAGQIADGEAWIESIVGHPLNLSSPPQMKAFFYEDLGLPPVLHSKTRKPTLDDDALDRLATKEPIIRPLVVRMRETRSLRVLRATFIEARLDTDGRVRCSYNVAGTETFRFSSSKNAFGNGLNLQNVPPIARKLFLPDEGYEIFDMDLDSADLRIVVHESGCVGMQEIFAAGLKPYIEIAKEYYKDPTITRKHPRYGAFKSLCHGTNYLGHAKGIASQTGLLTHEVERIQKWYFERFPEIREWQRRLRAQVQDTQTVHNAWGYRRHYFDRIEEATMREAVAWIPQSTVGLLINRIWATFARALPQVQILLQVHDSLVGQYPIEEAPAMRARLQALSQVPVPYSEPLHIPTGFKVSTTSWGDCG